jgi:hypothetical protein
VLVDDEASTGNTFLNLANACRKLNPGIERVHLATITNFMGADATAALTQRFGLPVTLGAPVSGEYTFEPGQFAPSGAACSFDAEADRRQRRLGRYGLERGWRARRPAWLAKRSRRAPRCWCWAPGSRTSYRLARRSSGAST